MFGTASKIAAAAGVVAALAVAQPAVAAHGMFVPHGGMAGHGFAGHGFAGHGFGPGFAGHSFAGHRFADQGFAGNRFGGYDHHRGYYGEGALLGGLGLGLFAGDYAGYYDSPWYYDQGYDCPPVRVWDGYRYRWVQECY